MFRQLRDRCSHQVRWRMLNDKVSDIVGQKLGDLSMNRACRGEHRDLTCNTVHLLLADSRRTAAANVVRLDGAGVVAKKKRLQTASNLKGAPASGKTFARHYIPPPANPASSRLPIRL